MTYFGFLALFLGIPLLILSVGIGRTSARGLTLPEPFRTWPARWVIVGHVIVAVLYTTPWDNYLVATRVWWYDPDLVSGIVLGYVPLEEYTFFILQTILTGSWVVWLLFKRPAWLELSPFVPSSAVRWGATGVAAAVWLASTIVLFSGNQATNYLTLILSWAFIPIVFQLAVGGDILWHYRRLVAVAIALPSLYLAAADAIAIKAGTWTISPEQTVGVLLGGILPLEEFLFFLLTNVLVVFGVTLVLARASHKRTAPWLKTKTAYV